jgi:GNAT superfamily N-acetyltransferase
MHIRRATEMDIPNMVAIAETKRIEYEGYAPVFWRKAPGASPKAGAVLAVLVGGHRRYCAGGPDRGRSGRVHHWGADNGALTTAPPVYNPGGAVCMVDDFAVAPPEEWQAVGRALLAAMAQEAQARGAILMVVVCARHDQAKRALLQEAGCAVASEWHVRSLSP